MEKDNTDTFDDLGFAKVDNSREARTGIPEVIYCKGKTDDQILSILKRMTQTHKNILLTRAEKTTSEKITQIHKDARYNPLARTISITQKEAETRDKNSKTLILIITAGTSDIPVAEEAKETLAISGISPETIYDIGIAGIHRMFAHKDKIEKADIIIAIAGMEGALPGLIAGITSAPVIAVPTSTGYGANLDGLAPLLTMLNTCAPGISVVNIDSGFSAACMAIKIANKLEKTKKD